MVVGTYKTKLALSLTMEAERLMCVALVLLLYASDISHNNTFCKKKYYLCYLGEWSPLESEALGGTQPWRFTQNVKFHFLKWCRWQVKQSSNLYFFCPLRFHVQVAEAISLSHSCYATPCPSTPISVTSGQFLRLITCKAKYFLMFWESWDSPPHSYCHCVIHDLFPDGCVFKLIYLPLILNFWTCTLDTTTFLLQTF